ncbi:MAG: biopolymer transporter ExbD [Gammaproteobacteria bacterium]|nr:biopolymer transporter ExbD [Gammaproteobacteria bacterium]
MEASRQAIMPMRRHRRSGQMSLTPLVDVVFILLIFFMLQTNFLRPRAIEFSHSAGSSDASSDLALIGVEMHADGSIWLNGGASSMAELRGYASRIVEVEKTRVLLAVDEDVILQDAVEVMDLFNEHDIMNISLSAARRFE